MSTPVSSKLSSLSTFEKLEQLLSFDGATDNMLTVIALGGLSQKVRQLWWASEESFSMTPSAPLQDMLSLHAQQCWQEIRHNIDIYQALSEYVKMCFSDTPCFQSDIHLHHRYPELPLIKFWLASASCCCRKAPIEQDVLWSKHLQLTQSLCIATELQKQNQQCIVYYHQTAIMVIELETRKIVVMAHKAFPSFSIHNFNVQFFPYPN
ncbi:hypothetical protein [Vibrio cortegadensis]|uniref:Uncharacterized protein n=1 Tax=Vibrio cortegadensis TaxID=1328770 RepID=A0ABV4M6Y6_9VIBR